ncbi:hypothetical protein BP5796_10872 [Coleophoma crateriformis]|uniref:Uncharacterized protein n=1 Tax=Coleophoma crateriformis TaxID=565419 RepID=A0A3D8QLN8_9HELO|nr:hypothetical protein BP5796_10872 [Coleophoma crateriformis]
MAFQLKEHKTFQVWVYNKSVTATQSSLSESFVSEEVVSSLQLRRTTSQRSVKFETAPGKSSKTNQFVCAKVTCKGKTEELALYVLRPKEIKHDLCLSSDAYARLAPPQQLTGSSFPTHQNSSAPYAQFTPPPGPSTTADTQYTPRQILNTSDVYPQYSQQGRYPATQGEVNEGVNYSSESYPYPPAVLGSYETTKKTWGEYGSG